MPQAFAAAWCLLSGLFLYPLGGREKEKEKEEETFTCMQQVRPQLSKALPPHFLVLCLSCRTFQGAVGGILGNASDLSPCFGAILALML